MFFSTRHDEVSISGHVFGHIKHMQSTRVDHSDPESQNSRFKGGSPNATMAPPIFGSNQNLEECKFLQDFEN